MIFFHKLCKKKIISPVIKIIPSIFNNYIEPVHWCGSHRMQFDVLIQLLIPQNAQFMQIKYKRRPEY